MEGTLKKNTTLTSESGSEYKVKGFIGAGGQGEVYEVECNKKSYALKWYFKHEATKSRKSILDNLLMRGAPDATFLWPQDIINSPTDDLFGYIMPLRPKKFAGIVDMMKRRAEAEPSFKALSRAAFNLAKGYEKLHSMGLAYADISWGNCFFDPDSGDVLICDNDNVVPNGQKSGIDGTLGFMAPEIMVGKAKPSRNTDLYSLSVLLFYMFMLNHPLHGKLEADIRALDDTAMRRLYGTDPVFIFAPDDKRNRPVEGYQQDAIEFWKVYPQRIKDLFIQSFTTGLRQPGKRVTEKQWMDALINLVFGIIPCSCGCEVFYDEDIAQKGGAIICWHCQNTLQSPTSIVSGKSRVLLMSDPLLYAHHTTGNCDIETAVGTVVQTMASPSQWGIRNDTIGNWMYIGADGSQIIVMPGETAPIAQGAKIDFGKLTGVFEKATDRNERRIQKT
jgi:serine/threonine protein kinase